MSDSLEPHELQHARPPCPSPTPRVYSNSCPSSWWCHPAISSSIVPLSSCPQSLPASGSFPMSQLFAWGGQNIGVSASASVLPVNTQDLLTVAFLKYGTYEMCLFSYSSRFVQITQDLVEEVNVIAVVTLPFPSSIFSIFKKKIFHVVTSTYFSVRILLEKIQM